MLLFIPIGMQGQQLPASIRLSEGALIYNPAAFASAKQARALLNYQDRQIGPAHRLSCTGIATLHSNPLGKHRNWAVGAQLIHDKVFIQHQSIFRVGTAVRIIDRRKTDHHQVMLSLGLTTGLILINSAYEEADAADPDDPLQVDNAQFREIDAGLGAMFRVRNPELLFELGLALQQIPGNWASRHQRGPLLHPHLFGHLRFLRNIKSGIQTGPQLGWYQGLYRAGFFPGPLRPEMTGPNTQARWISLAWKWNLLRHGLGFLTGYRSGARMLQWGIDIRLWQKAPKSQRLVLATHFAHPISRSGIDGSNLELGLLWTWR